MTNQELQLALKHLKVSTPFGKVKARQKDIDSLNTLIGLKNGFFDKYRLANNTFTSHELLTSDLVIIRDLIIKKRDELKGLLK